MTLDRPVPGVVVAQPRRGFRYGSEAFWLVGFALEGGVPGRALDLGTGSGIAALLLASRGVDVTGWDVRPEWGPCWAETLARSEVRGRVQLILRDVGEGGPVERVELVVSNPPFYPRSAGPEAPDPWKAAARTESTATLQRFVHMGAEALLPGGRLCLVVPAERGDEAVSAGQTAGLTLRRRVQVGRLRVLVELGDPLASSPESTVVEERGERVRAWYDALALPAGPS